MEFIVTIVFVFILRKYSRCGGQGDLLSGALAVFLYWTSRSQADCPDPGPGILAGWAASRLSRACAVQARVI